MAGETPQRIKREDVKVESEEEVACRKVLEFRCCVVVRRCTLWGPTKTLNNAMNLFVEFDDGSHE